MSGEVISRGLLSKWVHETDGHEGRIGVKVDLDPMLRSIEEFRNREVTREQRELRKDFRPAFRVHVDAIPILRALFLKDYGLDWDNRDDMAKIGKIIMNNSDFEKLRLS